MVAKKKDDMLWVILFVLLAIIIAFLFFQMGENKKAATTTTTSSTSTVTTTTLPPPVVNKVNVTENVPVSLKGYIDNIAIYDNQRVSIEGFLKNTLQETALLGSVYVNSIVDDDENEIFLTKLSAGQNDLFIKGSTTEQLYSVYGQFKQRQDAIYFEVVSIEPIERETKIVEKIVNE